MASREERLQQRLRGAQRRQVADVDFGLVFPVAPLQPVSPNRRTPELLSQPELPPQRSTRGTPGREQTVTQENNPPVTHNDANISAKRRKLDSDGLPSSGRKTRSQQTPRPDIYAIEDDVQESSVMEPSNVSMPPPPRRTPSVTRTHQEVTESPMDVGGSGRREANITNPQLQDLEDSFSTEIATPVPQTQRKRKRGEPSPQSARSRRSYIEVDELDELSPEQPDGRNSKVEHSPEVDEPSIIQESEEAEAINDDEAAAVLKKNRGKRISRNAPVSPDLDTEVEKPVKKRKAKSRPDLSPVKQRQPKPKQSKKVRIGSPIPVTVHRLTKAPLYDEDEFDADILNAEIPHTKRGGVNAIDVLSQICEEIIGAGLDTLENGRNNCEDPVLRREYTTKLRAVEAFGNELQTRLLEHTINLDNSFSLERRLRDEQKKKFGLREEILRIRAEREQVALRMDEVRIKHENETKKAQERDTLNTTVHDIELAIDLGMSNGESGELAGTELLLKRVADEVSNKSGSGGMLRKIKEFNAFLERAALVLESRRA